MLTQPETAQEKLNLDKLLSIVSHYFDNVTPENLTDFVNIEQINNKLLLTFYFPIKLIDLWEFCLFAYMAKMPTIIIKAHSSNKLIVEINLGVK